MTKNKNGGKIFMKGKSRSAVKSFLSIVLTVAMIFGLIPWSTVTVRAAGWTDVRTPEELLTAIDNDKNIKLADNITMTEKLNVFKGDVTIDLSGYTLDRDLAQSDPDSYGYVIEVCEAGILTLMDSFGSGTITGNDADNGGGVCVSGGTFNMQGGTITGNVADNGGGVYVSGGTFNMQGGTITGNTTGVFVTEDGKFNVSGCPVVSDNINNDLAKNVAFDEEESDTINPITVTGVLGEGARIGVTIEANKVFTDGLSGKGTAANFTSDSEDYGVVLNDKKEAMLKKLLPDAIVSIPGQTYTGSAIKPIVTITDGETPLTKDVDYTVSYTDNINAGTATVTVTGMGNYTGSREKTFTINPKNVSDDDNVTVNLSPTGFDVNSSGNKIPTVTVMDGENTLVEDTDYTVTIKQGETEVEIPAETGKYTVEVTFKGNYEGTKTAAYTIAEHAHDFTYTVNGATIKATCGGIIGSCYLDSEPALTIVAPAKTTYGDKESANAALSGLDAFKQATGLKVSASDITYAGRNKTTYASSTTAPTDAGDYTASITAGGVTASVDYSIAPVDPEITTAPAKIVDLTYTGSAQALITAGTVTGGTLYYAVTADNTEAADGSLYTTSIPTATEAGTYKVWYKVAGDGNYKDTDAASVSVSIAKKSLTITADSDTKVYDDSALTKNSYTSTTLVEGDSISAVTVTGSQTTAGSSNNIPSAAKIVNTNGGDVTANYEISYVNGTLQVTKADITPAVTLEGWTEGAIANTPKVTGNSGNGQVTFTYKVKDADDSTYTASVPTQPGTYTVKAAVAETANYNGAAATADFTITAAGSDEPGTDDPEHTHSLVKVDCKDSTQDAEGNIEYWKCSGCDKLFFDSEGTTEITLADTVIAKKKPTVTTTPVIKPTITLPSGSNTPAAKDTVLKATNANAEVVVTSQNGEPATAAYQKPIDPNVSNVTIPGSVSVGNVTYKVTEIEDGAFAGDNAVKNVKIEEGVESIGDNAFAGCENLKSVIISSSIQSIGDNAFSDCINLKKADLSKTNVEIIGEYAFKGAKIKKMKLPDTVEKVKKGAFANCGSLTTITFGKNIKSLGKNVVKGCGKLKTVVFNANKVPAKKNLKNLVKSMSKKVNIKVKKKVAAKYTAALNKAGFKGTVKRK